VSKSAGLILATIAVCLAAPAFAQRGGRGRSEAILARLGNYFVDTQVPATGGDMAADPLAEVAMVKEAASAHQLSLLYLYDPKANETKHQQFEQVLFGNEELNIALRCFRCARIDVSANAEAKAGFGKQAPLFVAFNAEGKRAGEVSMAGYKAVVNPLVQMLAKAATGTVKPALPDFVQRYRGVVHDLEMIEGRRKAIDERMSRLTDKDGERRAELEKDKKTLADDEQKLLATEKELLQKAMVPARDPKAQRLGGRERR
jgi:hypothetical protein